MKIKMMIIMLVLFVIAIALICVGITFVHDYNQNLYYTIVGGLLLSCGIAGVVNFYKDFPEK